MVELDCFLSILKMLSPRTTGGKKACADSKLAPVYLSAASVPLWWWDSWRLNSSAANLKLFNISVIISQLEAAVARVWKQSVSRQTTTTSKPVPPVFLPQLQNGIQTTKKPNQFSPTESHQSQNAVKAAEDLNQKHQNPNFVTQEKKRSLSGFGRRRPPEHNPLDVPPS